MRHAFSMVIDWAATALVVLLMIVALAGVVVVLHGLMKGDNDG